MKVKLAKLDALLAQSDASSEAVALIAELLSIETDQRVRLQQMTPQARRERTLVALVAMLAGLTVRQPVLLIYEDLHWIDPSSRELLDRAVAALERLPVLLLATFRPEFQPPWVGQPNIASLVLPRLDRHNIVTMIAGVAGADGLSGDIAQEIADRTDGVPLFIEEMTKAVIESGRPATEALSLLPHPALAIPPTLHASLIARLDRLGPAARDAAQKGAAIGREFHYKLIAAVADRPEPELRGALERLTSAGLLFARGAPPDATYLFKHALVQDAAYGSLVRAVRQQTHARIIAVLEAQFPEARASDPARLAQHCVQAGLTDKAVMYFHAAGQQALARCAMAEAVSQLRRGLNLLAGLEGDPRRLSLELDLQTSLVSALTATRGFSAAAVAETLARARSLAEQLDRPEHLVALLHGQGAFHFVRAEHRLALPIADQIVKMGEARDDIAMQLLGRTGQGATHCFLGNFVTARALLERCHRLAEPAHRAISAALPFDPYVAMLPRLANTLAYLGYIDQARSRVNQALSEASRLRHVPTLAHVLTWVNWTHWLTRSPYLECHAKQLLLLSIQHGFPLFAGWGKVFTGLSLNVIGQAQEGLVQLSDGLAEVRHTGPLTIRRRFCWPLPKFTRCSDGRLKD